MLAGGLDAGSCVPSWFERVVQTCGCLGTFWRPKHLPLFRLLFSEGLTWYSCVSNGNEHAHFITSFLSYYSDWGVPLTECSPSHLEYRTRKKLGLSQMIPCKLMYLHGCKADVFLKGCSPFQPRIKIMKSTSGVQVDKLCMKPKFFWNFDIVAVIMNRFYSSVKMHFSLFSNCHLTSDSSIKIFRGIIFIFRCN